MRNRIGGWLRAAGLVVGVVFCVPLGAHAGSIDAPVRIGLNADMSSFAARGGEAIRRGIVLAIDEINAAGGLLGRPLRLVVRDHQGNPARGRDHIGEFADMEDLLAVVAGLHTPVVLHTRPLVRRARLLYLVPGAAGTGVTADAGAGDWVFRVAARDGLAGPFLARHARQAGVRRIGLLLERTAWGRSSEVALLRGISEQGLALADVAWFNVGTRSMAPAVTQLLDDGAEAVVMVGCVREAALAVRAMAAQPPERRVPILSHVGIDAGHLLELAGPEALAAVDLRMLDTFTFQNAPSGSRAQAVRAAYLQRFSDAGDPRAIFADAATAQAYDLIRLLAAAVRRAGTFDRDAVRAAMESLGRVKGLVRDYNRPFTTERHDALMAEDYFMARFASDGAVVPLDER